MNNINLEEYKTDYNNCMRAEDMIIKYNINEYYFKKIKKILNLNRGNIGKLDYVLKNNNIQVPKLPDSESPPNEEPIKPKTSQVGQSRGTKTNKPKLPKTKSIGTKPKIPKTTINIKTINTDDEVNITEVKKCDTTYNDKSELIKLLNKTDETLKKSKQALNKKK
jgi:hypothetical protein